MLVEIQIGLMKSKGRPIGPTFICAIKASYLLHQLLCLRHP
jgi:hypothetical protein